MLEKSSCTKALSCIVFDWLYYLLIHKTFKLQLSIIQLYYVCPFYSVSTICWNSKKTMSLSAMLFWWINCKICKINNRTISVFFSEFTERAIMEVYCTFTCNDINDKNFKLNDNNKNNIMLGYCNELWVFVHHK